VPPGQRSAGGTPGTTSNRRYTVGLAPGERRTLAKIESRLRRSDPQLAAMFAALAEQAPQRRPIALIPRPEGRALFAAVSVAVALFAAALAAAVVAALITPSRPGPGTQPQGPPDAARQGSGPGIITQHGEVRAMLREPTAAPASATAGQLPGDCSRSATTASRPPADGTGQVAAGRFCLPGLTQATFAAPADSGAAS
jgi:hypothetical protein